MLDTNRRGTLTLYFILGLVILTLIGTGATSPPVGALLLMAYTSLVFATSRSWGDGGLAAKIPSRRRPRVTQAAQSAAERVGIEPSLFSSYFLLQDIGLIVDEQRSDGVRLRHSRFITLDEESVRPYIVLYAFRDSYPRRILVRFEMEDTDGGKQFIYEMEHVIQPGENLLIPDYRLPLKGNERISRYGGWSLGVSIDDEEIGIHRFNMLPSASERTRQFRHDGEAPGRLVMEEHDEAMPVSLEELLSHQGRR